VPEQKRGGNRGGGQRGGGYGSSGPRRMFRRLAVVASVRAKAAAVAVVAEGRQRSSEGGWNRFGSEQRRWGWAAADVVVAEVFRLPFVEFGAGS